MAECIHRNGQIVCSRLRWQTWRMFVQPVGAGVAASSLQVWVRGVFAGIVPVLLQWWISSTQEKHHKLELSFTHNPALTVAEQGAEHSIWMSIKNVGDLSERTLVGQIELIGQPGITINEWLVNSRPGFVGDQVEVVELDLSESRLVQLETAVGREAVYLEYSLDRLNSGDQVEIGVFYYGDLIESTSWAQSNDYSVDNTFEPRR